VKSFAWVSCFSARTGQSSGAGNNRRHAAAGFLPRGRELELGSNNARSGQPDPHLPKRGDVKSIEMKTTNVIYASGKLKAFLDARASGSASKELLMQLSADALAEQEADRSRMPRTTLDEVVIDFQRARRERTETK
jgi:hypothetical protein